MAAKTHIDRMNERLKKKVTPHERHNMALVAAGKYPRPFCPLPSDVRFDKTNPRSLIRLLPHFIVEYLQVFPERLFSLTENELLKECFKGDEPPEEARKLRISFWDEYDRCQRLEEKQMDVNRIIDGICNLTYFTTRFITDYKLLAWILNPPLLYLNTLKDIHDLSMRQLLAVAKLPVERDKVTGKIDTKLIELQQKIFAHVDMRIKGAIIQKIDQRNLSVNVDVDGNSPEGKKILEQQKPQHLSMSEVESKIKALEEKSVMLQAPMRIDTDLMRDVSPVVVDIPHAKS